MTALLVCGAPPAPGADYAPILAGVSFVIAVDAGLDVCRRTGRVPDAVIGDFDSATRESLAWATAAGARMITLPATKDMSDLDAALSLASGEHHTDIIVTAVLGGRVDHELAAIGSLARASSANPGLAIRIREPGLDGRVLCATGNPSRPIRIPAGKTFSALALLGPATVSIAGAEYPLEHRRIEPLSSLGLSNVAGPDGASVELSEGTVLVLVNAEIS